MKKQFFTLSKASLRKARGLGSEFARFPFFQKTLALGLTGAIALGLLAPRPAQAFIVFDPSVWAALGHIWSQDISTYAKIIQEVKALGQIYQNGVQVYTEAVAMSQMISHPQRLSMATIGPTLFNNIVQNRYGETANWSTALNGHVGLSGGAWGSSTLSLGANPYLALEHLGTSYLLARLASVEATDGASVRCTQILSQYHGNQQANQGAVQALKNLGLDITPGVNAVVAQLNLQNAGAQQARTEQLSQGNIQACLAEQQMLSNKLQRDQEVENLNYLGDVHYYQQAQNMDWADADIGFRSFRLP